MVDLGKNENIFNDKEKCNINIDISVNKDIMDELLGITNKDQKTLGCRININDDIDIYLSPKQCDSFIKKPNIFSGIINVRRINCDPDDETCDIENL